MKTKPIAISIIYLCCLLSKLDCAIASGHLAAGEGHTCAIKESGAVECWGWNEEGELGNSEWASSVRPVEVQGLDSKAVFLAAGAYHTCAILENGSVKCWGYGEDGELGDGLYQDSSTAVAVVGLSSGVISIAAANYHTCVVVAGGTVKCWGWNNTYGLGDGTNNNSAVPVTVTELSGATSLALGDWFSCALLHNGSVEC